MPIAHTLHAFTIYDYARMRESGILTDADRVELIDGEIRTMALTIVLCHGQATT